MRPNVSVAAVLKLGEYTQHWPTRMAVVLAVERNRQCFQCFYPSSKGLAWRLLKHTQMEPAEAGSHKTKIKNKTMKTIRYLILSGITVASLYGPRAVFADSTVTPPVVVVPHDGALAGVPADLKTLIKDFAATRDIYLAQQDLLLAQLKTATTDAARAAIRAQLEANRAAFLAELQTFRTTLKTDLEALKGKISHAEFLRIIDAAHDAATEGGAGHH